MKKEDLTNIKRDIACNKSEIEKIRQEFINREPAKETQGFIRDFQIDMVLLKEELKTLAEENAKQHKEILERIGRIESFILGLLILFALSAVYFIFEKVGLK